MIVSSRDIQAFAIACICSLAGHLYSAVLLRSHTDIPFSVRTYTFPLSSPRPPSWWASSEFYAIPFVFPGERQLFIFALYVYVLKPHFVRTRYVQYATPQHSEVTPERDFQRGENKKEDKNKSKTAWKQQNRQHIACVCVSVCASPVLFSLPYISLLRAFK